VVQVPPRLADKYRQLAANLEATLTRDPERARAALVDILGAPIRLSPDPMRTYLIAETEIQTPLKQGASGALGTELMVAGARQFPGYHTLGSMRPGPSTYRPLRDVANSSG
jgi:hypothetical protein